MPPTTAATRRKKFLSGEFGGPGDAGDGSAFMLSNLMIVSEDGSKKTTFSEPKVSRNREAGGGGGGGKGSMVGRHMRKLRSYLAPTIECVGWRRRLESPRLRWHD